MPLLSKYPGAAKITPLLPLPPSQGMPHKINTYRDVDEPKFDPKIHLNLERPNYIRLLPDFVKTEEPCPPANRDGSRFAFSTPFQV